MGSDSWVRIFMLASHFVPSSFFIRAIFPRPLLCMVLMWGDQVSFLSNFTPRYVGGVLLVDFLSIDLQDELFSLGRQGEAGGFSVDHYQPLFCPV